MDVCRGYIPLAAGSPRYLTHEAYQNRLDGANKMLGGMESGIVGTDRRSFLIKMNSSVSRFALVLAKEGDRRQNHGRATWNIRGS